jgi:glycosyltransferase involved in cell wall biosynthesis
VRDAGPFTFASGLGHDAGILEPVAYVVAGLWVLMLAVFATGLAVIEAMAMGRACVVSDVGGMRVTVEEGQSGLRAPPGDEPALAAALLWALSDEALRARLGEAAAARVREHYSIDRMQRAYERWYEDVLGELRPATSSRAG